MTTATLSWQQRLQLFLFFAFISYAFLTCISAENYLPDLADYINHLGLLIQAKLAMAQGQWPLRIAPLEQDGTGYPLYQFYSPTAYWLGGLMYTYVIPSNPMVALKMTLWLALICGGIYMYRLAYWFVQSHYAAILAGVIYLSAPYYILVVNRLGNFTEAMALGILPAVIFYSLQRFLKPQRISLLLATALMWYLLLTIHVITFVYSSAFVGLFLLGLTLRDKRNFYNLLQTAIAYGFGCLLGLWFIIPIEHLNSYFFLSETFSSAQHMQYYRPLLSHLIFPAASISLDFKNGIQQNHPAIGWPILAAAILSCYAYLAKKHDNKAYLGILVFLFVFAFFLAWSPLNVWQFLPRIFFVGQYPWRILSQVMWIGALLSAWCLIWLFKNNLRFEHLVIGIFIIVASTASWFPNFSIAHVLDKNGNNILLQLKDFEKNPLQIYNQSSYLLNFTQSPKVIGNIDSILLNPDNMIIFNKPIHLTRKVLQFAENPFILMSGELKDNLGKNPVLVARVNDKIIGKKVLKKGKFVWQLPLQNLPANAEKINLEFNLVNGNKALSALSLNQFLLKGFLKAEHTLNINQLKSLCYPEKNMTLCSVDVPQQVNYLELPIIYYPQMLKIFVNGKPAHYEGVLFEGHLYTGIKPESGTKNKIVIEFAGIQWANKASLYAWLFWFVILIGLIMGRLRFFFYPKQYNYRSEQI